MTVLFSMQIKVNVVSIFWEKIWLCQMMVDSQNNIKRLLGKHKGKC